MSKLIKFTLKAGNRTFNNLGEIIDHQWENDKLVSVRIKWHQPGREQPEHHTFKIPHIPFELSTELYKERWHEKEG